ncbi:MAG TPA: 16S rRNA (uracil(1498)-N(3))-methyltransferase [Steroidobacteraceae bacterium]|nr:16S rRNA (uracil(1498)-N(3))-methyltransferase [Steroidobacteraceae bacterium]
MRLTRVHVPGPLRAGATLELGARAGQHLVRVLRLGRGAPLAVFDGTGHEHAATISAIRDARVEVVLGEALAPAAESPLAVTLAQGVSRGERMDYAIQKATELGVARIVPLLCERSVVRLDAAQAARKLEHWQGIAAGAAEQSGRAVVPAVEAPRRYLDHLGALPAPAAGGARLVLAPRAADGPSALPAGLARIELLIGPEGGLSDAELGAAALRGYAPLRLGPRVLRTETAAAAAIAVLQARYGDLG